MKINRIIAISTAFLVINIAAAQESKRFTTFEKKTMEGIKFGIKSGDRELIPATYDKIQDESDGKFIVLKDQKVGYVDTTGKEIIRPKYFDGTNFQNGRAMVFDSKKWGMIDSKGLLKGQMIYDDILGFEEGIVRVVINNKVGYIDNNGTQIIPCKYDEGFDCYGGLIMVNSKYFKTDGEVNYKGKAIPAGATKSYSTVFNNKGAMIFKGADDEYVKFTPNGRIIVTKTFNSPGNFNPPSYSKVIKNDGKVIVPYESHYYLTIQENWVKVETMSSPRGVGIMDFDGNMILKPNFKSIGNYQGHDDGHEYAKVSFRDDTFFYIDENGKCAEFVDVKCPE
jgi:hypothetical protein